MIYRIVGIVGLIWMAVISAIPSSFAKIRNVCYNDSIISITFDQQTLRCGPVVKRLLFGQINNGAFVEVAEIADLTANSFKYKILSDLPDVDTKRRYFVRSYFNCPNGDSLSTDTIAVDFDQPNDLAIDSVSIELATQDVLVGWTQSDAPDVEGYRVYQYGNAVYSLLSTTSNTQERYTDPSFRTKTYGLVAFDSCQNFSPFLDRHKPMVLTTTFDTCTRQLNLTWNPYEGFDYDEFEILQDLNGNGWQTVHRQFSPGLSYNSINPDFDLGDSVCFLVRVRNDDRNEVSSTSTRSCVFTRAFETPTDVEIEHVSIVDDEYAELKIIAQNTSDVANYNWQRGNDPTSTALHITVPSNPQSIPLADDRDLDVDEERYFYKCLLLDKCDDVLAQTDTSNNIVLRVDQENQTVSWNPYLYWSDEVSSYTLETSIDGSTWNFETETLDNSHVVSETQGLCFRVTATNPRSFQAVSNVVCIPDSFAVYIPNAINPNSENHRFVVKGTGINYQLSTMSVYNRWGQRIYITDRIDKGWDVTYGNEPVMPGIYIYVIDVYSNDRQRQTFNGEFIVLK